MRDPRKNLGRTQQLVLHLIAAHSQAPSIRDLAYDWPSLTESAARSAVNRLGDRRLVDVAGFHAGTNTRTYKLTALGRQVEVELVESRPCAYCEGEGCDMCQTPESTQVED